MQQPPRSEPPWAPGLVHLSAGEAPIACTFRAGPEDFEVEELAAFEPAGEGAHLFLFVEKRELSTPEAVRLLARVLGLPRSAFGTAGRKDRQAVSRQWISVEGIAPETVRALAIDGLRVLRAERHPQKLRVGQLRGNRFRIRLREVALEDRARLERVLALLVERGLPNYYGPQRFGGAGLSFELGRLLVQRRWREYVLALASPPHAPDSPELGELRDALEGERRSALRRFGSSPRGIGRELAAVARQLGRRPGDWRGAVRALDRELTGIHLSALQARIFNRVLAQRVAASGALGFDRLERGDLAFLHDRGAVFAVERPEELEQRLRSFEISPSGPVPGHRMAQPTGAPGEIEDGALAAEGLALADFRGMGLGLDQRGARRPLRVRPDELTLAWQGDDALLDFALPKGSFATALVDEVRKDASAPYLQ